jgi:hypothetical protein
MVLTMHDVVVDSVFDVWSAVRDPVNAFHVGLVFGEEPDGLPVGDEDALSERSV